MDDFTSNNPDSLDGDFKALLAMRRNRETHISEQEEKVTDNAHFFVDASTSCFMRESYEVLYFAVMVFSVKNFIRVLNVYCSHIYLSVIKHKYVC